MWNLYDKLLVKYPMLKALRILSRIKRFLTIVRNNKYVAHLYQVK